MSKYRRRPWGPMVLAGCLAAFFISTATAQPSPRKLFAQGGRQIAPESPLWVVQVEDAGQPTASTTVLQHGEFGIAQNWKRTPGTIPAGVVGVTHHGSELILLLDTGTEPVRRWAWFSTRFSLGPPLPEGSRILAMAGDRNALWALGRAAPAAATTAPATQALAPTQPAAPVLYELEQGQWAARPAKWPVDVASVDEPISMALVNGRPTLAVQQDPQLIQMLQFTGEEWVELAKVQVEPGPPLYFKVLPIDDQPALWVQPPGPGIGGIWVAGEYRRLEVPPALPDPLAASVTVAGDQIRAFYELDDKLWEQRYRLDGAAEGEPLEVKPVAAGGDQMQWVTVAIMALATVLILNVLLRRRASSDREGGDEE